MRATSGSSQQAVAALAGAQRGLVTRRQLLEAGFSPRTVSYWVTTGRLQRLHRGIFALGHAALAPLAREYGALLACGEGALLSHQTAAALWQILRQPGSIHVTVHGRQAGRPVGVIMHRTRFLPASQQRARHGLPLTSPARTILDMAPELGTRELERTIDEALVKRITREEELEEAGQIRGHHGGGALNALLAARRGSSFTRSEAEELALSLIRQADLPAPEVNVHLHGFEVDFYWRRQALVLEVDGYAFHASRGAFERDRRKDAKLGAAGITVIRVTWLQLQREPLAVIARLAAALTAVQLAPAG